MKCKEKDCFNCPYPDCVNDLNNFPRYNAKSCARYYKENKEKLNNRKKQLIKERKEKGLCTACGKNPIAENSTIFCKECYIKKKKRREELRREKGILPRHMFNGVDLCTQCGKEKPVKGYKQCAKCLEKSRKRIAYAATFIDRNKLRKRYG